VVSGCRALGAGLGVALGRLTRPARTGVAMGRGPQVDVAGFMADGTGPQFAVRALGNGCRLASLA